MPIKGKNTMKGLDFLSKPLIPFQVAGPGFEPDNFEL
jgi:hypothetical protein